MRVSRVQSEPFGTRAPRARIVLAEGRYYVVLLGREQPYTLKRRNGYRGDRHLGRDTTVGFYASLEEAEAAMSEDGEDEV